MLSIADPHAPRRASLKRREFLRIGGLGALGLGLPQLLRAKTQVAGSFGRAKSCVIIFLSGGAPQHETFDPKTNAVAEIRGEFGAIQTTAPGVQFSELLPRTARQAHRMAVIRSMSTDVHSHSTSGYQMLTGFPHANKNEGQPPSPDDWPSIAAVAGALRPSERCPVSSVVLPEIIHNNPNITWPGQNGGFMGPLWHPHVFKCDPRGARVDVDGLEPVVPELRLSERRSLLAQMDTHFAGAAPAVVESDRYTQQAFDLLQTGALRAAFEMDRESAATRDTYGRHKFGQALLLARRLTELGVRLVQVNWPREPGDTTAGSPLWDTHQDNAGRLKNVLCPQFDGSYSAFLEDLFQRGLLDETLVVVMSEFGRTPKVNANGGRDHWGSVFSIALAGAGIAGGQVIGASDRDGALPDERPVRPMDLSATIFHFLGIAPTAQFADPLGRPRLVTDGGVPLRELV